MTLDEIDELLATHEIDEAKLAHWNQGWAMMAGWCCAVSGGGNPLAVRLTEQRVPTIPLKPKEPTS